MEDHLVTLLVGLAVLVSGLVAVLVVMLMAAYFPVLTLIMGLSGLCYAIGWSARS